MKWNERRQRAFFDSLLERDEQGQRSFSSPFFFCSFYDSFNWLARISRDELVVVVHRSMIEINLKPWERASLFSFLARSIFGKEERNVADRDPPGQLLLRDSLAGGRRYVKVQLFGPVFRAGEADWCVKRKLPLVFRRFYDKYFRLLFSRSHLDTEKYRWKLGQRLTLSKI